MLSHFSSSNGQFIAKLIHYLVVRKLWCYKRSIWGSIRTQMNDLLSNFWVVDGHWSIRKLQITKQFQLNWVVKRIIRKIWWVLVRDCHGNFKYFWWQFNVKDDSSHFNYRSFNKCHSISLTWQKVEKIYSFVRLKIWDGYTAHAVPPCTPAISHTFAHRHGLHWCILQGALTGEHNVQHSKRIDRPKKRKFNYPRVFILMCLSSAVRILLFYAKYFCKYK